MLVKTFVSSLALGGLALGYADFLTNPRLANVADWKREAENRAGIHKRHLEMEAARVKRQDSGMTRGSQPNPTDPCFNVYQIDPPSNNPSGAGPDGQMNHGYQAPQSNDVRGPCPALNTLANHGYLPRDGRNINGSTLVKAFAQGWGVAESVISIPKTNALAICTFQSGGSEDDDDSEQCEEFDLNVLNTPHEFEHDHSLSRLDYEFYAQNGPSNNHIFNGVIFNATLDVLQNDCYMDYTQANSIRLTREAQAYEADKPYWFTLAPDTQETEIGFIFGVMRDFTLANYVQNPLVRVSWWQYWFMYESFPTPLGWKVPTPAVSGAFVNSVSSAVQSASITSTPGPFFTEFVFGPTGSFPTASQSGQPFFNPTLPNLYNTVANNGGNFNRKRYVYPTAETYATQAPSRATPTSSPAIPTA